MKNMLRGISVLVLMLMQILVFTAPFRVSSGALSGEPRVEYSIRFPELIHHEAEISVRFTGLTPGETLEVRMSRTSPGRYALHEFAKNVYRVRAFDSQGNTLDAVHVNPHQWDVSGHDGTVVFEYTLFADQADGTYSAIDVTHVHLNMPATFIWARGLEHAPIEVAFNPPVKSWRVATQLFETGADNTFSAPDLQYFFDSPAEISDFDLRTWTVEGRTGPVEIRLAVHHEGTSQQMDAFASSIQKIVRVQYDVFDGPPDYDSGTYTFLVDYLPHVSGDGMEHRNSTYVTGTTPLTGDGLTNLGTMAHEFFHQWNVERIRPETLEPFSFEEENQTDELWFAEGVTSYYTPLSIRRAGLLSDADYASQLSGTISDVVNSPGRNYFSAVEMSRQAPFMDRASTWERTNKANTFLSYYTWGSAIGLALDLTLRSRFNSTLDDLMRIMWTEYGVDEIPYTGADIEARLSDLTGSPDFARDFFSRYIRGMEVADYEHLLGLAGFMVQRRRSEGILLGGAFSDVNGAVVVETAPLRGTPLFESGIDIGDRVISVDGESVSSARSLAAAVDSRHPGEILHIRFLHRGVVMDSDVELVLDPTLEVVLYEDQGRDLTPEQAEFRDRWLFGNQ